MKIGELRHRVSLQRKAITEDALKQQTEIWTDTATVWASVELLSGREYFAARQTNLEVTVKIIIRYRAGVTSDMRVLSKGKVYEIETVIDPKERHEMLHLLCKEGER